MTLFIEFLIALGLMTASLSPPELQAPADPFVTQESGQSVVGQHPLPPARPDESGALTPKPLIPAGPISCELRIAGSGEQRMLMAVVSAEKPVQGSFTLELNKKGANTIRSRQKGEFSVKAGESQTLAHVGVNIARGDTLTGRLDIRGPEGEIKRCATL